MNNSLNLKSVEGAVWSGLFFLGLVSILLVASAIFPLASASMSESNASTLPGPIGHSTVPLLDHSVVNREGVPAEHEPSSPMSAAYFHV